MTDKKKIRKEVERLRNLHQMKYQHLDTSNNMSLVECGKRNLCNELLSFIDSLQEEPVSEVLEDAADKYSQSIHSDYFNGMFDSHNIYDAVIYGAKWGKHQAEVETQAQSMALAHGCPKEFITKDLENAAFDYAEDCKYDGVEKLLCVEHFKAGAKWQKQRIIGVTQKYADKGHHMYNDFEDDDISDTSELSYWDGFLSCAECIKREL